jgi:hypothetical protein
VIVITAIVSDPSPNAFTHRRTNIPDFTAVNEAILSTHTHAKRTTNIEAEQSTHHSTIYNANLPAHRATLWTALWPTYFSAQWRSQQSANSPAQQPAIPAALSSTYIGPNDSAVTPSNYSA